MLFSTKYSLALLRGGILRICYFPLPTIEASMKKKLAEKSQQFITDGPFD